MGVFSSDAMGARAYCTLRPLKEAAAETDASERRERTPRGARRRLSDAALGSLLIVVSAAGFSSMHAVIRHVSADLHSFEIAFFRNLFGLVALTPFFLRNGFGILRTERFPLHFVRASLQAVAMLAFFTALRTTPLALASSLSFTAPLFAAVGAIVLLRERVRLRRVAALVLGFVGALIILRPGAVPIDRGSALVLGSSFAWALTMLLIKHLSETESSLTLTAYMGLLMTPLTAIPASTVWVWPDVRLLGWLVLLGTVGGLSQLSMAEAFRRAEATAVLPFDYSRLVWASVLGYVIYDEVPEIWTWLGGTLIFASTVYIAYREASSRGELGEPEERAAEAQ
ncbi:MAG: DMT family transporter [Acidobacteriota bacterium]